MNDECCASRMTPNDGEDIAKASNRSRGILPLNLPGRLPNLKKDYKMTVGRLNSVTHDENGDKKFSARPNLPPNRQRNGKGSNRKAAHASDGQIIPDWQTGAYVSQNDTATPSEQTLTVGTDTTFADIGTSTEPESLGPCEPGTCVQLSGIVWHETESGVLVVNVTWRNRSYVGTLLDATKHDWAPPRIPDVDSDAEYRAKSGRSKRRCVNATDGGRKGRKSAFANNGFDEYKCSHSSNKRRCAKMSESDGNDAELIHAPGRSAKRSRMSRTATAKLAARIAKTAKMVKESSGDGTSGSRSSSACSSPVFIECPHANCEKRYKDDDALKYHEAHAHPAGDMDSVKNTVPADEGDSVVIDSPKDSDNTSTKSSEAMVTSDSTGSPNIAESEMTTTNPATPAMETRSAGLPSFQSPFVVASAPMPPIHDVPNPLKTRGLRAAPMHSSIIDETLGNKLATTLEEFSTKPSSGLASSLASSSRQEEVIRADGGVSSYTLSDSQPSDPISLKSGMQTKHLRSVRASLAESATTNDRIAASEHTAAVDIESAQAVITLLKLQENTQDRLPGVTSFERTLEAESTIQLNRATAASSQTSHSPTTNDSAGKHASTSCASTSSASSAAEALQFRDHSKDGAPLPRMSVSVASSARCNTTGSYPHDPSTAVTALLQDRRPHYTPTGLKTGKVKTVPIPTDSQQTLAAPSTQPTVASVSISSAISKKQKRYKKPKAEPGISLGDPVTNPRFPAKVEEPMLEVAGIKQENAAKRGSSNDGHVRSPGVNVQIRPGPVPPEPDSRAIVRSGPSRSRPSGDEHLNFFEQPRAHAGKENLVSIKNPDNESSHRVEGSDITVPSTALPPFSHYHHASAPICTTVPSSQSRNLAPHPAAHTTSHSLPGSWGQTPMTASVAPQSGYRQNQDPPPTKGAPDPKTRFLQDPPLRKDAISPPSPPDHRRSSGKSIPKNAAKSVFSQQALPFLGYGVGQYPVLGAYSTQFMNDLRHYDQIIQQEIRKDQKPKEEQPNRSSSPKHQHQNGRKMSPSRVEERAARESSPKVQHHRSQAGTPVQAVHRVHAQSRLPNGIYSVPLDKHVATPPTFGRGPSPHPRGAQLPISANRPPRPNSDSGRASRRDSGSSERCQATSRTSAVTQSRKNPQREECPDRNSKTPERANYRSSPTSSSMYAPTPAVLASSQIPVRYFAGPYQPPLFNPSRMPSYFAGPPYMFPSGPHLFHGAWPHGSPPPIVVSGTERPPSHSPHAGKLQQERPSSGIRLPCHEKGDSRTRDGVGGRGDDSCASAKERRACDGPNRSRKCVTPDSKVASGKPSAGEHLSAVTQSPMQRHLHTHHHIHEAFSTLIPPQYQYQMASAVMAGSAEAAAALAQFPKRDIP